MPIPPTKMFRVFVSSTFSDLVEERDVLYKRVYPRLRELCERLRAQFQAVDLRWGVSEEAAHDQRTMAICLEEIKRCRKTTARPNFIIVAGDRYGWRPLPAAIPVEHVQRMLDKGHLGEILGVVKQFYSQVDENAIPAVYCLSPLTAEDAPGGPGGKRQITDRKILDALQKAAAEIELPLEERARYGASATEQEIVCGLLGERAVADARTHVHAFLRTITNLPKDQRSQRYLDWMPLDLDGEDHFDDDAYQQQRDLKDRLRATLSHHAHDYIVTWPAAEASGPAAPAPAFAADLEEDVYEVLAQTIVEETTGIEQIGPLAREVRAHEDFAGERASVFIGRAGILKKVARYLAAGAQNVFAMLGPSGSGKSAAMARAWLEAQTEHPDAVVVTRFVGTTPESSTGAALLASLTHQVSKRYLEGEPPVYTSYLRIAGEFRKCLELATAQKPLVLFLDGLDQIPLRDEARSLNWLPLDGLPEHVRLVVSASTDSGALAEALESKLDADHQALLEPMSAEEAGQILDRWLKDADRLLKPEQRNSVIASFNSCALPLYLRLAFEQARLWRSFDEPHPLGADVVGIIRQTFANLADPAIHGETLVRSSLGYLTAAKDGLAEHEMIDVLSANFPGTSEEDQEVMRDFRVRFPKSPPVNELPLVVWSRLYYDLKSYLSERNAQGTVALNYFHRQLREAARSQYLGPERHRFLARYFASKPNFTGDNGHRIFQARKLSELPYQQRKAGMSEELEATLSDLDFIEAKCSAGLIYDLLADYDAALRKGLRGEQKTRIASFQQFVRAQANLLSSHPELTLQQALNEPDFSGPEQAAARLARVSTRPRCRWVNKPQENSPCIMTLEGHTGYVNSCAIVPPEGSAKEQTRIASGSSDKEIKFWDAANGREVLVLRGHRDTVQACSYSHDGRRIVSGSGNGEVKVWDAVSGKELWSGDHHEAVPCCRFSPDGRLVVSASWEGTLKIWNADDGTELRTIRAHEGQVFSCEFVAGGTRIASAGGDGALRLWSVANGERIRSVAAHDQAIMSCRISADGGSLFTASQDAKLKRWDADTLKLLQTYTGHEESAWAAAVSPDGTRLVSGSGDGSIRLWDVESGATLASIREHGNEIWELAFFADGARFVSACWDGTLKVWDTRALEGRQKPAEIEQRDEFRLWGYMIPCCCSPDESRYAAGSKNGSLRIWDAETGKLFGVFPVHNDFIYSCAYSPDNRWIVSGSMNGWVKIFDAREQRVVATESVPNLKIVLSCAFTRDSQHVMVASEEEVRIWAFEDGRLGDAVIWPAGSDDHFAGCVVLPEGHSIIALRKGRFDIWDFAARTIVGSIATPSEREIATFALSRDGKSLAVVFMNGNMQIYDVSSGTSLLEFDGQSQQTVSCNFSPDGRRLVITSREAMIRLWDLDAPRKPMLLAGHTGELQDACFTPDGKRILSTSVDGTVRLWDAQSGAALGYLLWLADSASTCALSSGDAYLVTASHRHRIRLWNGVTGELERVLSGHKESVRACQFSARGQLLSASADGTLRLWDPRTGGVLFIFEGHGAPVEACAFSPDGEWFVSAARDRKIRLWDTSTGTLIATLEGHEDWIPLVMVTANGTRIVSCSLDKTVRVWDSVTRQCLHVLRGHETVISAATTTPNGSRIISGGEDGVLHVWDTNSGRQVATLSGHTAAIRACTYARNTVVSASQDGTLGLWELETGNLRKELQGHQGPVHACAVSPGGFLVASAAEDQFVKLWEIDTGLELGKYWAGAAARSVTWGSGTQRIAVGDARGRLHLLDLEGTFRSDTLR